MKPICESVVKKDHADKVSGRSRYVADYPKKGMLFGKTLHSSKAKARINKITLPKLPEGYFIVDRKDVKGENKVAIVKDDMPVFARETVEYIGEAILMVVGPSEQVVEQIVKEIQVDYEELPPILDIREHDTVFFDYHYGNGDVDQAFEEADQVFSEEFETGYQEQAYLETQGMIGEFVNGKLIIRGSMQCPYYVFGALKTATGLDDEHVQVMQTVTGGGFGGKEAYPSILACQTAVAAMKADKPVRVIYDRREDMEFTSKRHPSLCRYRFAVKDQTITAMDLDIMFNAGAYTTLSAVVLQRGIICANGVYNIPNLRVHGCAVKTNTTPCGAYRGFGAPQTFFAVERMMDHVADKLGINALDFKFKHLVKQGDRTSTGGLYHFPVPIPAMVEEVVKACDYRTKKEAYQNQQADARYRRGIGMSLYFHGAGFTGSGERDLIKAVAKLHKYEDGTVEILASNTDIGQGLKTTFSKIVAKELNLPLDQIRIENPDTDRVPDSGPTVASRSLMTVGELLRRAAIKLKVEWQEGVDQIVEEHFKEPDFVVPFSLDEFKGDAYPTYAWGVNAIEVEVDTLTATTKVVGAYGSFDVGTPIDLNIVIGQMEGGFLQGIGYASIEYMAANEKGRIRNNSLSDYLIPTSRDVPNMQVMMHVEEYPLGPYGAKGAGELPLVGAAGAYVEAMEQALNRPLYHAPFTAEDTMKVLLEEKTEQGVSAS
ncbi:MAG: xanthine dehydrogenase family protein [Clostridia bacterium]|nr:xanthine dehydrogenase family protein [Clostridia bacterium]